MGGGGSTPCNGAMAWREVSGPKGKGGTRIPASDLLCDVMIGKNRSGYCECPKGHYYYDANKHEPMTCEKACAGQRPYQLDETRNTLAEYREAQLKYEYEESGADKSASKILVIVIGLVIVGYILLPKSSKKNPKDAYLERTKGLLASIHN